MPKRPQRMKAAALLQEFKPGKPAPEPDVFLTGQYQEVCLRRQLASIFPS